MRTPARSVVGGLALGITLALLSVPLAAGAQPAARVYRIGVLASLPPTAATARLWEGFVQGLRELGYVEGKNLVIERRYSEGRAERYPALAAELVRLKVDVIFTGGAPAPEAAKQATSAIPIVFGSHTDPVGSGLVASLARPGGNITGLSLLSGELVGKHLQLLMEAVPRISRVAVLSNPSNTAHESSLRQVEVAARSLKVGLQVLEARAPSDLTHAFSAATTGSAEGLIVIGDPMFWGQRARIAELAAKNRLPTISSAREFVEAGGLMAYGANLRESWRRAATYVDKILRGAKPADLPVEQPTKFEFVINMKTARALGLTLPESVRLRADEFIQ